MGNQHAKMIIGLIHLDGISLSYDCEKGVGYLFDSLIIVDKWWVRNNLRRTKYRTPSKHCTSLGLT